MSSPKQSSAEFSRRLVRWQEAHGRHDLPWQGTDDAYRVWLSEIMLQQTQVATVIPYYGRFLERFPDLAALAAAPLEEVLGMWSGLGYYARARNLHRAARQVTTGFSGRFPREKEAIAELPGIGRSTAAAIAVFAFGARAAILDGNVKRVLTRSFGVEGFPGEKAVENRLWALAESLLPQRELAAYTQGLMDLGATVCLRAKPDCERCPVDALCIARREGRTAELPGPRPRKSQPRRSATLLLLRRDGRVLLERRPPAGIWGGLLSLPELPESESDPRELAQRDYGCLVGAPRRLTLVKHAFSHFRLDITPLLCEVERETAAARESDFVWLGAAELTAAPLPAPIRKILAGLPD